MVAVPIFPDIGSLIEHVSGIAGEEDIILVKARGQ
jgi:hypothetical protein